MYIGLAQDEHGNDHEVNWSEASWLEPVDTLKYVGTSIQTDGLKSLNVPLCESWHEAIEVSVQEILNSVQKRVGVCGCIAEIWQYDFLTTLNRELKGKSQNLVKEVMKKTPFEPSDLSIEGCHHSGWTCSCGEKISFDELKASLMGCGEEMCYACVKYNYS